MIGTDHAEIEVNAERRLRLARLTKKALEKEVIEAIRNHRLLVDADEIIYAEWVAAAEDPMTPAQVMISMQKEYLVRQRRTLKQQMALIDMIDLLGYQPIVAD